MEFNRYQELARRTQDHSLTPSERLEHALFGLGSETGEVLGIFQKAIQKHPIVENEVFKELGDILWFISEVCDCYNVSLDYIAQLNIAKLLDRYPDEEGFNPERSLHRKE